MIENHLFLFGQPPLVVAFVALGRAVAEPGVAALAVVQASLPSKIAVGAGLECAVVAPCLVSQRPGERVKTDPRDARKLAQLHAGGLLEPLHVPTPELEPRAIVSGPVRTHGASMRARHRLSKLLLRNDCRLPTRCWGRDAPPLAGGAVALTRFR